MKRSVSSLFVFLVIVSIVGSFWFRKNSLSPAPASSPQNPTTPSSTLAPVQDLEDNVIDSGESVYREEQTPDMLAAEITLNITVPPPNQIFTSSVLTVKGTTIPNAEVFVNDVETVADGSGNFSTKLTLDEGENYIVVTAVDASGNVADKELTVIYQVEE